MSIEAEAGKISIALSNLVKNAITFTDSGGHVFITAEAVPGYVKVSVVDDGIGIPIKDLPHIFDRFYRGESSRSKDKVDGYGLGLSIAKSIVDKMGGKIKVVSAIGKGSTFTVQIPVA